MITPSVVDIVCFECSVCIVDMGYITQEVSAVDVSISCILEAYRSACAADEIYRARTTSLSYEFSVNIGESNTVLLRSYSVCIVLKGSCEFKLSLNSLLHLSLIVNIKTRPPKRSGKNHFFFDFLFFLFCCLSLFTLSAACIRL